MRMCSGTFLVTARKRASRHQLCYKWILPLNATHISRLPLQKRHQEEWSSVSSGSLRYHNHLMYCCTTLLIITAAIYLFPLSGVSKQVLSFPAKALQFNFSWSTRKKKSSHLLESWAANLLSLVAGSLKIINPVLLYIYECNTACWVW